MDETYEFVGEEIEVEEGDAEDVDRREAAGES